MTESTNTPALEAVDTTSELDVYETPTLQDFGTIETLTQGTFAGVGADNGIYS